ncbi:hypothetical protein J1C56_02260 [Aminobacter anthyllidis]|uniref:Uncharacterized protein n=1 Tax=Aminobacter anthyllidis TaxID=1035067 RepID=A0A9X1A745_9HYPH|nr:hypothetical protein [Aminobacter anthyllidis]MBT1154408.1 hypothetical protein [Aminobacter anthyllidis]
MTSRMYHTLLARDGRNAPWKIEFGDYSRATVEAERRYYRDQGYKAASLKIITTGDTQAEINAAVDKLNAGE